MKHLAIFGASGHGKVVADTALQTGSWGNISFFDDRWPDCQNNDQWKVIGNLSALQKSASSFQGIIIAVGNNQTREKLQLLLLEQQANLVTLIHPSACIGSNVNIGVGTVVFANTVVNIGSNIGSGCIINTGATIDHDCQLSNFSHVSPGANLAGAVSLGSRSWVGIGASIIQETQIGNDVIIGAGSSVVVDIPVSTTVVGCPAKPI